MSEKLLKVLYGSFSAHQGVVGCVRVLQSLLAFGTEPRPGLSDDEQNDKALCFKVGRLSSAWWLVLLDVKLHLPVRYMAGPSC